AERSGHAHRKCKADEARVLGLRLQQQVERLRAKVDRTAARGNETVGFERKRARGADAALKVEAAEGADKPRGTAVRSARNNDLGEIAGDHGEHLRIDSPLAKHDVRL